MAVVTGGTAGIGRATVRKLAEDDPAHGHSPELWLSQHRGLVSAGAVPAAAGLAAFARK